MGVIDSRVLEPGTCHPAHDAILEAVADGAVLVGTVGTLTHALGVTAAELRLGLRELLEANRIAVYAGPHGQLTIREERRKRQALAPVAERRRPAPDLWIF
jgi:hypothetical protein